MSLARFLRHTTALLLGVSGALLLSAAPIEADLGDGLRYHRAHQLPGELPGSDEKPGALILDLRYTAADEAAATALDGWIKFRAAEATPVFVLVNADTAPTLHGVFAANRSQAGFLTVGTSHPDYSPDVVLEVPREAERRAYDRLEQNESIATLLAERIDKPRFDEEAMIREAENKPGEPADDDFGPLQPAETNSPAEATPPVDLTLQRAVHLHRALKALKRIP